MLAQVEPSESRGQLRASGPLGLEIVGFRPAPLAGDRIAAVPGDSPLLAEIVSVTPEAQRATTLGTAFRARAGQDVRLLGPARLDVTEHWLGRVVDPLGAPLDGGGKLRRGGAPRMVVAPPPAPGRRGRLGARIALGVRALDLFCTMREGQRLGLFAASGIGKSTLLAMLAGAPGFDVVVLGLVGERGRELREFLEDDLGPERLARSVVVCATSDSAAPLRREAALAAMTVAEHFRDRGQRVLLLLDSVTRFALACREIGLAAGEPPATRGYPPSVFAELPRLLERAGPGEEGSGSITLLATVLVEGDDHDEPVADAVRGILDGHVVLDRAIAERGRYPAVDVLRSLSRTVPGCLSAEEAALMRRARAVLALAAEMADMVRLGAYRPGTDAAVDEALRLAPRIEALLAQRKDEPRPDLPDSFARLAEVLADGA
ncbi:FliI/YscN family ATPase [Roseomonas sp. AR75]|uniref:FliI/YscN family ATPase n=1 Tax=Roseomonas sp. AR75 TaxID=2562311 RepID=UPI0010C14C80|nr:FliI/YscN family ATPase [Roseomonas sp. AR75]